MYHPGKFRKTDNGDHGDGLPHGPDAELLAQMQFESHE
jgi:hypothetical protein